MTDDLIPFDRDVRRAGQTAPLHLGPQVGHLRVAAEGHGDHLVDSPLVVLDCLADYEFRDIT